MSIWFVTPAYGRYELSAICFEQRARVIERLAAKGVEAQCVVVADDENLDIARGLGFATVEQTNEWLGRKFNDGMAYAAANGARWIVPIGSDSWIDPAYFLPLPLDRSTRTGRWYAPVEAERVAIADVRVPGGAGPYMFHRDVLARTAFRPAQDELSRGIDGSTLKGIGRLNVRWQYRRLHPYQYVGFRGYPHITRYGGLRDKWGRGRDYADPWTRLAAHYPADLVERARRYMVEGAMVAA